MSGDLPFDLRSPYHKLKENLMKCAKVRACTYRLLDRGTDKQSGILTTMTRFIFVLKYEAVYVAVWYVIYGFYRMLCNIYIIIHTYI